MSVDADIAAELDSRELLALVDDVCRRRGVPRALLLGATRTQSVTRARHEVWWRLRHDPERHYSLHEIARLFRRDHTTVAAGLAAHARRVQPG